MIDGKCRNNTLTMIKGTFEAVGKVKTVIEQTTPDRDEDEMEFSL